MEQSLSRGHFTLVNVRYLKYKQTFTYAKLTTQFSLVYTLLIFYLLFIFNTFMKISKKKFSKKHFLNVRMNQNNVWIYILKKSCQKMFKDYNCLNYEIYKIISFNCFLEIKTQICLNRFLNISRNTQLNLVLNLWF